MTTTADLRMMMPDTNDGWPDKYSDPRDRPHPSVLRITVESFDKAHENTLETVESIADSEEQPAVVSFATVGDLRKILTDRRIELLQLLRETDGAAASISALAKTLDRDYRTVHDDVSLLADYGLIFVVEEGRTSRPYLPYERVHLDVDLVNGHSSEKPASA